MFLFFFFLTCYKYFEETGKIEIIIIIKKEREREKERGVKEIEYNFFKKRKNIKIQLFLFYFHKTTFFKKKQKKPNFKNNSPDFIFYL